MRSFPPIAFAFEHCLGALGCLLAVSGCHLDKFWLIFSHAQAEGSKTKCSLQLSAFILILQKLPKRSPKDIKAPPKGTQKETKKETKGGQAEPKGAQREPKGHPKDVKRNPNGDVAKTTPIFEQGHCTGYMLQEV